MIEITEHPDGCIVRVRAQPGAKGTGVVGKQAGALKVAVTAAPEQGKANKALIDALSKALGLKRPNIELISGATSRNKRFLLKGVSRQQIQEILEKLTAI